VVSRHRGDQQGFTLIELSIVILIILIISYLALPRLRILSGAELSASTRRLAQTTRYLYEEAALRGAVLTLFFDLDRQQYWVARAEEGTGFPIEEDDVLGRRVALPPGVRIAEVSLPGNGKFSDGVIPTRFYPEGYADRVVIRLADDSGRSYTVSVDPVRGRAEVSGG